MRLRPRFLSWLLIPAVVGSLRAADATPARSFANLVGAWVRFVAAGEAHPGFALASAFLDRPGVDTVQDLKKLLEPVFVVLDKFSRSALILAAVMLVAAILLISNTIRVAAFSRRRETGIMRLVGASNFYIQLPFLLEGAIAGLFGGILGSVLVGFGKWFLVDLGLRKSIRFTTFIGWGDVMATVPIMIVTAVLISVIASYLTLLRYLRV